MENSLDFFFTYTSFTVAAVLPAFDIVLLLLLIGMDSRSQSLSILFIGLFIAGYHHLLLAVRYTQIRPTCNFYQRLLCLPTARRCERCMGGLICFKVLGLLIGVLYCTFAVTWLLIFYSSSTPN